MSYETSPLVVERNELVADSRVENWPLMSNWWPTLLICLLYYLAVNLFTKFMRQRPPFEFRKMMIIYNFAMVVLSMLMFVSFIYHGSRSGFNLSCWPVNSRIDSWTVRLAFTFWLFYFSKMIEFLDTMFFIARKKFHLVTVLHVYHHMVMPATTWLAVKYSPGGFITTPFSLNCLVHVFMYTYYGLAAAGPEYQKYLWWKKYMTMAQIGQFVIIIVHCAYFLSLECRYSKMLVMVVLVNAFIFLFLFFNYFFLSYKVKKCEDKSE